MPTKYANVIIEVDDKSLIELGAEMQQVAINLSKLKIGTKEWIAENQKLGELKNKFNAVTREAQKLQGVVEKIGAPEQLRAFAKLGAGLVGAFSAASGSLKLLGIQSEAFDEMTAKATTLMSIMGGLNQVSETFSKENLKGLKAIGSGFGTLVTTVKNSSNAMKIALASTGIGLLVVGVGLLIANWDKLSGKINNIAKAEKEAEDARRIASANMLNSTKEYAKEIDKNIEAGKKELEQTGSSVKLRKAELDAVRLKQSIIDQEIRQNEKLLDDKNEELETQIAIQVEMKKRLDQETVFNSRFGIGDKNLKEMNANYEKQSAIVKGIGSEITTINQQITNQKDLQVDLNGELEVSAEFNYKNAAAVDAVNEKLRKQQDNLTAIGGLADAEYRTYVANYNVLQDQIDAIKLKEDASAKYNKDAIDALKAQQTALTNAENERIKQYKLAQEQLLIDIEILNLQREYNIALAQINYDYSAIITSANEMLNIQNESNDAIEANVTSAKKISKVYDDLLERRSKLFNFDEKGRLMFDKQNEAVVDQLAAYDEMIAKAKQRITFGALLDEQDYKRVDLNLKIVDAYAKELAFFKNIEEKTQEKLKHDIEIIEQRKVITALQLQEKIELAQLADLEKLRLINLLDEKQLQLSNTKNLEDRKKLLDEIAGIENEIISINQTLRTAQAEIITAKGQVIAADSEIAKKNEEILVSVTAIVDKEKEVTAEVVAQSRAYAELQKWLNTYAEEIEAVREALFNSIELIASVLDRKAEKAQERIDGYAEQLDELNTAEEDRKQRLIDLEEELKDANGTRYDELMARIKEEKDAELGALQEIEFQKLKLQEAENKKLAFEAKAAKWRKANSIIEATIAGALAVIKALPNVFLAVATGVASAAEIGIIAAQKTPTVPDGYAEGGYTGDGGKYEVAGTVHRGEYIVPAHVVKSSEAQPLIQSLEIQRQKGYANGGLVPSIDGSTSGMIDYDRMAIAFYNAVVAMPRPEVSVVKITNAQNEVYLTKTQAGLTR